MAKSFETLVALVPSLKTTLETGDVGEIEIFYQNVRIPLSFTLWYSGSVMRLISCRRELTAPGATMLECSKRT